MPTPTAEEVIQAILGRPPDQPPSLVVDRVKRAAKLQADARLMYKPWSPRRATPAPGPPPPVNRAGIACPRCALPTGSCVCSKLR